MSINLSNSLPPAPAGSTLVTFATDGAGNVSAYTTAAVELTANGYDNTAQVANIGTTPLVAVPVKGRYRISAYIIVTSVGTTSTLPSIVITWNDADSGVNQSAAVTPTNTGNTTTTFQSNDEFISADVSAAINFSTTGYASTGTPMQFAIHITVEKL